MLYNTFLTLGLNFNISHSATIVCRAAARATVLLDNFGNSKIIANFATHWFTHAVIKREPGENPGQSRCCKLP